MMLSAPQYDTIFQERYEALMMEMQLGDKYGLERIALPKRKVVLQVLLCWQSPPHTMLDLFRCMHKALTGYCLPCS